MIWILILILKTLLTDNFKWTNICKKNALNMIEQFKNSRSYFKHEIQILASVAKTILCRHICGESFPNVGHQWYSYLVEKSHETSFENSGSLKLAVIWIVGPTNRQNKQIQIFQSSGHIDYNCNYYLSNRAQHYRKRMWDEHWMSKKG